MKKLSRITIAFMVFLSGVVLVPAMGLPTQGFNWQRYASVYDQASLAINHDSGAPGSIFTIVGRNFAPAITGANLSPDSTISIYVNGIMLGTVETDASGDILFLIDSTGAEEGYYLIEAVGSVKASTRLLVDSVADLWPQEDDGMIFNLNFPGVVPFDLLFMPVIQN